MSVQAIGEYILVREIENRQTSASGLITVSTGTSPNSIKLGIVMSVGKDAANEGLSRDDQVYYTGPGIDLYINGEQAVALIKKQILAVKRSDDSSSPACLGRQSI